MRHHFSAAILATILFAGCGEETTTAPPPQVPLAPSASAAPEPPPPPPAPPPEPPKPSMLELQKKTVAAVEAAFNAHDAKAFGAAHAENVVLKPTGMPEIAGRAAVEKWFTDLVTGFPDAKLGTWRVWHKGPVMVHEWVLTGTNTGSFKGMAPTNKPIGVHGAAVVWFDDDGMPKEVHHYVDGPTMMGQLGHAPKGAPPVRPVASLPTTREEHVAKDTDDERAAAAWIKSFFATFGEKTPDKFLAMLADDATYTDFMQAKDTDKKNAKAYFEQMQKVFKDVKIEPTKVWAIDGAILDEGTLTATNGGVVGGPKTKGKPLTLHGLDVQIVKDGKLEHGVSYGNGAEMLGELGLLPPPGAAPPAKAEKPAKGDKGEKPAKKK